MKAVRVLFQTATLVLLLSPGAIVRAAEPDGQKTLPVFQSGKWAGKHAVYEHRNFQASMDERGVLSIQPLEDGKPVGKAFTCYELSCYYNTPMQRGRPVQLFTDFPKPQEQPRVIHLKGMLADQVPFEVMYEFDGATITASGGCEDPKNIEYKTNFRILSRIPPSHNIPPQMEQAERKKLLADFALETQERVDGRKRRFKYPYYEKLQFNGTLEEARIKDIYGSRVILFEPRRIDGRFSGWIYSGRCPWEGFLIQYITDADKINLRRNQVKVTID